MHAPWWQGQLEKVHVADREGEVRMLYRTENIAGLL
jgi:hypothetical protein